MGQKRDEVAHTQAVRQWALPECVHVPVAAADEEAIADHIGDIIEVFSPGRALAVAIDPPSDRDDRLPIWQHTRSEVLFDPIQVWVNPSYTRYRAAYSKLKGAESISAGGQAVLSLGFPALKLSQFFSSQTMATRKTKIPITKSH
jgi:hypothetical protein